MMKDAVNMVVGSGHRPGLFDQIESANWDKDVDYCLYQCGGTSMKVAYGFRTNREQTASIAFECGLYDRTGCLEV
jgi:hypothetical protein